jgi:hypothetical protein
MGSGQTSSPMIVVFPLLVIAATVIALRSAERGFVLPLAAVLLLWVARRAPHLADALGGEGAFLQSTQIKRARR